MKCTLIHTQQETSDVRSFLLEPERPIVWEAGQYMHYILPHEDQDDRKADRYFTISAAPFEKNVRITTRFSEKGSSFKKALKALKIGDHIEAEGPEGDFTLRDPSEGFVCIAGGIGITPFRSILVEADHAQKDIKGKLLYTNRNDEFVFRKELDDIASRHAGFHITHYVDPNRIGEKEIRSAAPDIAKPTFYVSGPEPMAVFYEKMLLGMGVPTEHIKKDDFPGYEWE
ncbi:hypothetical protein A2755_00450 [Candidatus Wolfebacteria bacterium RIFCSPHIGHO2_01_FULL_48_22]|uniref:FAD-binding FR-type domain-containing protein n=2 Tax=Candidatus Wolfeibacteriota TaxID=1752735 RepID=A0A1F8DTR5_9BACT|nr:MAG: hypothetical protein A2755_00450 [Candidatus Wolfebacteria bacterium RIFCSPHIGHO2_01_FULL_48_22]OGM93747.1 MAG: hypothetical protein A2935_03115 [Candidatus Wolfebacteria bacterium RIFCSPLOWO2_01_FULL_47_17b]